MAAPLRRWSVTDLHRAPDFRVREIDVPIAGLPADLDGLRMLQLSDIHLSAFLSEARTGARDGCRQRLARRISPWSPAI